MAALDSLRARVAELADLYALARLAAWDQRTMMPPRGAPARGHVLATLERLSHDRETADEIGGWLDELEATGDGALSDVEHDMVRLARRDFGILGGSRFNDWFDAVRSATMADSVDVTLV